MLRTFLPLVVLAALGAGQVHAQAPEQSSGARPATQPKIVNLNTASTVELQELPGIGAVTAARIIEYREKNGPFKKIEEIMNVQGIGEKVFLRLRPQLTVGTTPAAAAPSQN